MLSAENLMYHCLLLQFDWTPYYNPVVIQITPAWIYEESNIWPSVTALICFATVEWHQVDRVLRQLGGHQHIPDELLNIDRLHSIDGRGNNDVWWPSYHREFHKLWEERRARVIRFLMVQDYRPSAEYIRWYSTVAQRFLSEDTILRDPRQVELPGDVPTHIPPVAGVPRPAHVPDRRRRERRLRVGTRTSHRQPPANADNNEDDSHDEDCSNSQPHRL